MNSIRCAIVLSALALLAVPASAFATTRAVYADAPGTNAQKTLAKYAAGANAFFPETVSIHTGGSIAFTFVPNTFHSFDIPRNGGRDLPVIVPGQTVNGDNDAAGNPFWFNGKVPALSLNPALIGRSSATTYDGTQRLDSGLPIAVSSPYVVTFTKSGKYKFFCDVHPGMFGYIVVRKPGKHVESDKEYKADLALQVKAALATAKQLSHTKPGKDQVSIGASSPSGIEDYAMFPHRLKVKVGTIVKFFMSANTHEDHTASFGPASYLSTLSNAIPFVPMNEQQAWYASTNPRHGPIIVSPAVHGNGFASTGVLDRDPATSFRPTTTMKFTKPGTYKYICLLHSFMHGTIVVTP